MARKRVIPRVEVPVDLSESVAEYLTNRSMRERSAFHEDRLKRDLMAVLEAAGELVEKHKRVLALDAPIPWTRYDKLGQPKKVKVGGIERRERVSNSLNDDKALALLARKNLLGTCTTTVVVVDEDAILAANYAGQITDQELADLYQESSTFAFYPIEES
jgi:hypothetical protein